MKILISPTTIEEAATVIRAGADIVDAKNVAEGSLGAARPSVTAAIVRLARGTAVQTSATLGDLPDKPGTAALAALGATTLGLDYVKAGLLGATTAAAAERLLQAVCEAVSLAADPPAVVAAGYADYREFGGLDPRGLVRAARRTGCSAVMLDTLRKDGRGLLAHLDLPTLQEFVDSAHQAELAVALAGAIQQDQLAALRELQVDIVGVRGAVCRAADRTTTLCPHATAQFLAAARQ